MNELKDMLLYLRKRENLTQRELADKLNISAGAIAMYETGKRVPTLEIKEAIADYFNVSLDVLCGRTEPIHYDITREEYDLIILYRKAPKADKEMFKRLLSYYERIDHEN